MSPIIHCPTCEARIVDNACSPACPDNPTVKHLIDWQKFCTPPMIDAFNAWATEYKGLRVSGFDRRDRPAIKLQVTADGTEEMHGMRYSFEVTLSVRGRRDVKQTYPVPKPRRTRDEPETGPRIVMRGDKLYFVL